MPPNERIASAASTSANVAAVTPASVSPELRPPPSPKQMITTVQFTVARLTDCGMRAMYGCSTRASSAGITSPPASVSAIVPSPTSCPAGEVHQRGREHERDAVREQHERQQVAARHLRDVRVGGDQRRGRRRGDHEQPEAERVVQPDQQPHHRHRHRGDQVVEEQQRHRRPDAQRLLPARQRPDGQQRLQPERRHRQRLRRPLGRERRAEAEAERHRGDEHQRRRHDPPLPPVVHPDPLTRRSRGAPHGYGPS